MAEPTPPPDGVIAEYNPFKKVYEDLTEFGLGVSPAAVRNLILDDILALRTKIEQFELIWAHGFKTGYVRGVEDTEAP